LVDKWATAIGLRREDYGTFSPADQGDHLQDDWQPTGCAAPISSHQDRCLTDTVNKHICLPGGCPSLNITSIIQAAGSLGGVHGAGWGIALSGASQGAPKILRFLE
jgi:hypothetical protein